MFISGEPNGKTKREKPNGKGNRQKAGLAPLPCTSALHDPKARCKSHQVSSSEAHSFPLEPRGQETQVGSIKNHALVSHPGLPGRGAAGQTTWTGGQKAPSPESSDRSDRCRGGEGMHPCTTRQTTERNQTMELPKEPLLRNTVRSVKRRLEVKPPRRVWFHARTRLLELGSPHSLPPLKLEEVNSSLSWRTPVVTSSGFTTQSSGSCRYVCFACFACFALLGCCALLSAFGLVVA